MTKEVLRKTLRSFYRDQKTGEEISASFNYRKGLMSHLPDAKLPEVPAFSSKVLVIPARGVYKIDLGGHLPETGMLRVRIRAARTVFDNPNRPALRLKFGFQPSNDSRTSRRVDDRDVAILADRRTHAAQRRSCLSRVVVVSAWIGTRL